MTEQELIEFRERFFSNGGDYAPEKVEDMGCHTDAPKHYAASLAKCKDWDEVYALAKKWEFLCRDALLQVETARGKYDWEEARKRIKTLSDTDTDAEQFVNDVGAVFMPGILFFCSIVSEEFGVPWGVAFVQSIGSRLDIKDGIVSIIKL